MTKKTKLSILDLSRPTHNLKKKRVWSGSDESQHKIWGNGTEKGGFPSWY